MDVAFARFLIAQSRCLQGNGHDLLRQFALTDPLAAFAAKGPIHSRVLRIAGDQLRSVPPHSCCRARPLNVVTGVVTEVPEPRLQLRLAIAAHHLPHIAGMPLLLRFPSLARVLQASAKRLPLARAKRPAEASSRQHALLGLLEQCADSRGMRGSSFAVAGVASSLSLPVLFRKPGDGRRDRKRQGKSLPSIPMLWSVPIGDSSASFELLPCPAIAVPCSVHFRRRKLKRKIASLATWLREPSLAGAHRIRHLPLLPRRCVEVLLVHRLRLRVGSGNLLGRQLTRQR